MEKDKKVLKILVGYVEHWYKAKLDCTCAICTSQEEGTYMDGITQAINLLEGKHD